jgi:hypothetical protein
MGEQFPAVLCSSVSEGGIKWQLSDIPKYLSSPGPHGVPLQAALQFLCYPSVFSDEFVDILLVALSCSSSRSTTARLIGDVRVSVLKMFHSPFETAGTHAGISIHTTKSLVDESCRVSVFHKKFNDSTLTKPHVSDTHFLAVHDGNVRDTHAPILHTCWRRKMPLMVLQRSLRYSRRSRDSFGISLGYGLVDREFEAWQGLGIFLFTTASTPALGPTQLPIQWLPGALSLGVKQSGLEADHSLPSNAEVKNAWSYISTPQFTFMT